MSEKSVQDRLSSLEWETNNASVIPAQIDCAREALELLHRILRDLVKDRDDADDFKEDLDRIDELRALML